MKTERKKMLSGELYVANDPELVELQRFARTLTKQFHVIDASDKTARQECPRATPSQRR